jgi:hypothetical protein
MIVPIFNSPETVTEVTGFTQYIIKKVTLLDAHDANMLFVMGFPWIVSGVTITSIVMGNYQKSYSKRIIWRWKSYTWGSLLIMGIFSFLSVASVGLFYIPTIFLMLLANIYNK